MPNLVEQYRNEVMLKLMSEFSLSNPMQAPRVEKIVVNIGLGEALDNAKALDAAVVDLMTITGQRPVITRARKSIANFQLRAGQAVGAKVQVRPALCHTFDTAFVLLAEFSTLWL